MPKKSDDMSKYLGLVARIRVQHPAYRAIYEDVKFALDAVGRTPSPVCQIILGESRTGKSSVVRDLLDAHPPKADENQQIRTVVYAVAPPYSTIKSLLGSLLKGLGDPHWHRGTELQQTDRLHKMLEAVTCKMIILDEFQHLSDKGQRKRLYLTSDWLKNFLETSRCGLLAVGLPDAAAVINNNPQLCARFDDALIMPLFDWRKRESANQFRGVLLKFQSELQPFELPPLDGREMALRMYLATAGRVGLVAKLLDRAVREAIRRKSFQIRIEDLAAAYDRAIWAATSFPAKGGPFKAAFDQIDLAVVHEAVLEAAAHEPVADESGQVAVYGPGGAVAGTATSSPRRGGRPRGTGVTEKAPGKRRIGAKRRNAERLAKAV